VGHVRAHFGVYKELVRSLILPLFSNHEDDLPSTLPQTRLFFHVATSTNPLSQTQPSDTTTVDNNRITNLRRPTNKMSNNNDNALREISVDQVRICLDRMLQRAKLTLHAAAWQRAQQTASQPFARRQPSQQGWYPNASPFLPMYLYNAREAGDCVDRQACLALLTTALLSAVPLRLSCCCCFSTLIHIFVDVLANVDVRQALCDCQANWSCLAPAWQQARQARQSQQWPHFGKP
jgi:hypothetical protein